MFRHMRGFVIAISLAFLPFNSCGGQDDRSSSARDALAAVAELRTAADEYEAVSYTAGEMEKKMLAGSGGSETELQALHERRKSVQERARRLARDLEGDLDRRLEKDPKDAGLLDARSRFRETVGEFEKSLADLDAARAILPKDAAIRARRPGLLRRLGRFQEAQAACAELLKEDAGHPVAIAVDGLCLYALNLFPEAIARLGEATAKEGRLEPSLAAEVKRTLDAAKTKRGEWDEERQKRAAEEKAGDLPRVKLVTSKGDIVVELFENEAPNAVASFIDLCDRKIYDGTIFHRVYPGHMVQGGDPLTKDKNPQNDGSGDAGYKFDDEFPPGYRRHFRGVLSLVNEGKDRNGSQFVITRRPLEPLDGQQVVFGRVADGMAVVDSLTAGDELKSTEILRKRPHAYRPVY
jgi:cyclophilin family peptidyl-prolyl cis-trans isomerase